MSSIKKVALVAVFLVMKQFAFAQAPWVFPFQAVARYPNSGVIANKAIKVRFTIKDATSTGTTVYQETQSPITSALGLFSVNIGSGGTSVTGTISTLTWGTSLKFLQVEMDTSNAGTSYVSLGTQQLLSVPYALNAASIGALTASGSNIGIGTTTPTNPLSVVGKADFSGDLSVNGLTVGRGGGGVSTNTALGTSALTSNTTGSYNVANGFAALLYNTTGTVNVANGNSALRQNTTGNYNNAFGSASVWGNTTGSENVGVGTNSLYNNTTGGQNTALGNGADVASGALTNATAIGYTAKVAASNTIQLGNTAVTSVQTSGNVINLNPTITQMGGTMYWTGSFYDYGYNLTPADIISGYLKPANNYYYVVTMPTATSIATALGSVTEGTTISFKIYNWTTDTHVGYLALGVNTGITTASNLNVTNGEVGGFTLVFTSASTAKLYRDF